MNIEELISENLGTIVDVRTPGEFMGGNVVGSVNVPLNELPYRIEELKNMTSPLILCCASGNRSSQAEGFLSSLNILCVNGGSWMTVNYYKSLSPQE
ncbi:MAG: rhodanese-like domain-containing protein [Saprospiraceae bacterium]|jgi:rhodanese-related sulfurtransferase